MIDLGLGPQVFRLFAELLATSTRRFVHLVSCDCVMLPSPYVCTFPEVFSIERKLRQIREFHPVFEQSCVTNLVHVELVSFNSFITAILDLSRSCLLSACPTHLSRFVVMMSATLAIPKVSRRCSFVICSSSAPSATIERIILKWAPSNDFKSRSLMGQTSALYSIIDRTIARYNAALSLVEIFLLLQILQSFPKEACAIPILRLISGVAEAL